MRKFTLYIITGLFALSTKAQTKEKMFSVGKIDSDTSTISQISYKSGLPTILKSKNKIEIRFIDPSTSQSDAIVLSYDKEWLIENVSFDLESKKITIKKMSTTLNLDTFFTKLVSKNVFSIPDESKCHIESWTYNPKSGEFLLDPSTISDGVRYYIEFKIGDYYRKYGYGNPQRAHENFPEIHELADFTAIVNLFLDVRRGQR